MLLSALHLALSARDFAGCSSLGPVDDTLYQNLVTETDPSLQPSSVPMVAATCLVQLYGDKPELVDVLTPWMTDPARAGLAMVVAASADHLSTDSAVKLAQASLQNPDATTVQRLKLRFGRAQAAEVRAVVTAP